MKKAILILVLAMLTACTLSRESNSASPDVIKIGVIAPLTGPLAFFGEWMKEGFELALYDINRQGAGKKIELIYEDTVCLPKDAVTALNSLNARNAVVFLGPFCGSEVKAAAAWADQNKKVIVSPGNNFGKLSPYFFNTEHLISEESAYLAKYAYETLGLRRIGFIGVNNDWGLKHKESFTQAFEALGGKVTATEMFNADIETDFRTYLIKIKKTNPDGIFIAFSAPAIITNQIRELGMNVQILGERGLQYQNTLEVAGKNAEGLLYTYPGDPKVTTAAQEAFISAYQAKYGKEPHLVVMQSYDALKILALALNACKDRGFASDCLADFIAHISEFDGARGKIMYEGSFWNIKIPFHIRTIRNGEFKVVDKSSNST